MSSRRISEPSTLTYPTSKKHSRSLKNNVFGLDDFRGFPQSQVSNGVFFFERSRSLHSSFTGLWQLKYFWNVHPENGGEENLPFLTVRIFVKWVGEKPPTRSFTYSPEAITSSQVGVGGDLSTDDVLQLAPFLGSGVAGVGEARKQSLRGSRS